MKNIKILSKVTEYLFYVLGVVSLWFAVSPWFEGRAPEGMLPEGAMRPDVLSTLQIALGIILSLIIVGFLVIAYWNVARMLKSFAEGEFFMESVVGRMVSVAKFFALHLVAELVVYPIQSFVVSINNPVGERLVAMAFGAQHLSALLLALSAYLLSYVMKEGLRLKQENEGTV